MAIPMHCCPGDLSAFLENFRQIQWLSYLITKMAQRCDGVDPESILDLLRRVHSISRESERALLCKQYQRPIDDYPNAQQEFRLV